VIYRFGPFEADDERYELRKLGRAVPIQRRTLDLILFLAGSEGRLVTPAALIAGPWQGTAVSQAALSQAIMQARRALTGGPGVAEFIRTVRGKGFRFDAGSAPADRHSVETSSLPSRVHPGPAEVQPLLRVSVATARTNPELLLGAHLARVNALLESGDGAAFDREAQAHRRLAERTDHPVHDWYAGVIEATRLFRRAQVERATALVAESWPRGLTLVGPLSREIAVAHLLNLALEQTARPRRRALGKVHTLVGNLHRRQPGVAAWRTMLALTELQLGDPTAARRVMGDPARLIGGLDDDHRLVPTLVSLVDLLIAFREGTHLRAVCSALRSAAGRNACLHFADWGPVAFHLGRVTRELGEREASRRYFEQALAESKRGRSTCWESWAAHGLARALADSGKRGAAGRAAAVLRGLSRRVAVTRLPALSQVVASFWPFAPASFLRPGARLMKGSPAPQVALKRVAPGAGIRKGNGPHGKAGSPPNRRAQG
jgi:DNA-binding winged helix-turn-helix (wHTH) protein